MSAITDALQALGATKPGTAAFAAAFSHVQELRAERPESTRRDVIRQTPCGFGGSCVRLFQSEVGANDHASGRKVLSNVADLAAVADAIEDGWIEQTDPPYALGHRNPLFCQGAADFSAAKMLSKRAK